MSCGTLEIYYHIDGHTFDKRYKENSEIYSNTYDDLTLEGAKLTLEFVAFLKEDVTKVLEKIRISKRKLVQEVTLDLSPTMVCIVCSSFSNPTMTNDHFHVQKLFYDAIDELQLSYWWIARYLENDEIQHSKEQDKEYIPFRFAN